MEYKRLLDICEQLLKHSALPLDMLEKYYLLKEKTLSNVIVNPQANQNVLVVKIIQLFAQCFNQMLTQRDINITNTETTINHLLVRLYLILIKDTYNANDLRSEFSTTFQLLLQINSDRKELDATVTFLQNEIRKIKLELNMSNSRLDQQKKLTNSEDKERSLKLQRQIDELKDELQTKIEEHEEQVHQLQFKYDEQIKALMKKNKDTFQSESKYQQLEKEQKQYEEFFDKFAEMSLPYLEKYERDFEKQQAKSKKYSEQNISENEILLDFLFYLLQKYVPLQEDMREVRKSSAKKSNQASPKVSRESNKGESSATRDLHFEQYKVQNNNQIDDTVNKLKQELEQSRKTLEKYELSRNKLQNQIS
ncbi:unnamed protein product [Paramecium primaurelia]|uniref:Uncharacterized protein n=1 Tax=Paramecium primaurelia TaxID=5886 RepID=A0A8S1KNB7_PARPR|nr:unnamed protein product [Paramecium primaurelia]